MADLSAVICLLGRDKRNQESRRGGVFPFSTVCFTFQLYCGCFYRQKQRGIMFVEGPWACSSSLWAPRLPLLLPTCKINLWRCDGSCRTLNARVLDGNFNHLT